MNAMQKYVAANLALAWQCTMVPTASESVWLAWRGGTHPSATVWIDETALDFERAWSNALAVLGSTAGVVTVMPVSAATAQWSARPGGEPKTLALPVRAQHPRRDLFYCETCGGRHEISRVAGTPSPMSACRQHENMRRDTPANRSGRNS